MCSRPKISYSSTSTPAPAPAVQAPVETVNKDTEVDTNGITLKRKSKGKKGLMIEATNVGSGANGTGLNI
mgnify:CR=1 FL=1